HRPTGDLRGDHLAQHGRLHLVIGGREPVPAVVLQVGPAVAGGVVAPQAEDLRVPGPGPQPYPRDRDVLPRLDVTFAVPDPHEPLVSPARTPAVLGDPARLRVVVPDERDAMAALDLAGDLLVHPRRVAEEVGVHG